MNILHINNFHYMRGGSEAVYFKTAKLLEEHGHNSVFFSVKHPETTACKTEKYFIPYIDLNVRHNILNQFRIAERILYSFQARKCLSRLLDKYKVDIAHLHNIYHHVSPSILYELKKRGIPVVMTLHDYKMVCASYALLLNGKPCEACSEGKYFKAIKNRCVKNSLMKSALASLGSYLHHNALDIYDNVDVFISPSAFLKDKLFEMGFRKEVVYLSNFIDMNEFEDIKRETGKKEKSIVYFGRLSFEKGLWTLIEVSKRLMEKDIDIQIKIIGDGLIGDELKEKVKSEGIHNIRFLGYLKGKSLFSEIACSTAVVVPSEWYENNPVTILESFALGIPVIGADIGGIPELVKDNETGLIFKPGNAIELSAKIEYMINNPDDALKMGQNAGRFAGQELSAEKYHQRLMEIYEKVLES